MDRDDLKWENKAVRKENWPPLTSSLYGFSQQVVQVHWFAESVLTRQMIKESPPQRAACKDVVHAHAFQTQAQPCKRPHLVAVFFEKLSGRLQGRKSSLVRKFTLQTKKREGFKCKGFILTVRSHNRLRSVDLSMAKAK